MQDKTSTSHCIYSAYECVRCVCLYVQGYVCLFVRVFASALTWKGLFMAVFHYCRHHELAIDLAMFLLPSPVFRAQSPGYPSVHVADALYLCHTFNTTTFSSLCSYCPINAHRACAPPVAAFRVI